MEINKFQRVGALSNTHAGNDFESLARAFFAQQGVELIRNFAAPVGVGAQKKLHRFDLGSEKPPVPSSASLTPGRRAETCQARR